MSDLIFALGVFCFFGTVICTIYLPMCVWFYVGYRKHGGHKSLWQYINEDC